MTSVLMRTLHKLPVSAENAYYEPISTSLSGGLVFVVGAATVQGIGRMSRQKTLAIKAATSRGGCLRG